MSCSLTRRNPSQNPSGNPMTMDLAGDAFFLAYLSSLTSRQLENLKGWQEERITADPSEETILDCTTKKRMIHLEQKRRRK